MYENIQGNKFGYFNMKEGEYSTYSSQEEMVATQNINFETILKLTYK